MCLGPVSILYKNLHAAILRDTPERSLRGMRTYARYAELDHLPKILMTASSIPAAAADVAAPIRKLCPEYGAGLSRSYPL